MRRSDTMKQPPPQRSTASCLVASATLLITAVIIAISLFLPPFDLPERLRAAQYTPLNAASPAIALDADFRLSLPPADSATDFALKLARLSIADIPEAARDRLPAFLSLASPLYALETRGAPPDGLHIELKPPANAPSPERLALYGWDGKRWRFIPTAHAAGLLLGSANFVPQLIAAFDFLPAAPVVMIAQEVTQDLAPEIAALADILSPAGLRPTLEGSLVGGLAPGGATDAPYRFMPLIRNFSDPRALDIATVEALISRPQLRAQHIARISDLAEFNKFDGVFIDYRGLTRDHRADCARFITELAASLKQRELRLGVVVGAAEAEAYDWRRIGEAADFVQLRPLLNPLAYAPGVPGSVDDLLRQATSAIARNKLLLGFSARSIRDVAGVQRPIGWHDAFAALGDVIVQGDSVSETGSIEPGTAIRASLSGYSARAGWLDSIQTAYIDYLDEGSAAISRIWLTDGAALAHRLASAEAAGIAGVAFDDLLAADGAPGLAGVIGDFKAGRSAAAQPLQLRARWSIDGEAGALDQVFGALDADFALTLEAPDGNYAINWAVVDAGGAESARRGAVVPLFQPTATPTPTPTPTPIPRPVVVATPSAGLSAPGGANYSAAPPPPGSINIEIGGHVLSTGSGRTVQAMRSAGMTWMKIQARFYRHGPPDVANEIGMARNNGFKILVGTVGNPDELAQGGQAYVNAYTDWLMKIAAQGADAIEVWNEPNLDREWPRGQISGHAYARMLQQAYQKIKSVNGGVMVISAAPAPTGAEAAFPGQVMNDDRWLREMVEGGGLNYLDCVGAHYNEGIIPPDQTSGDPRQGDYYTRYFYGMLNTYWGITGRPICFTELGYLTSEGLPGLPPYFSWARNVTVAQQAAWLAQAAALASQSGQVRLFIVWNIDFQHYGADPQAGFAIIRPDGSCPACGALASAR